MSARADTKPDDKHRLIAWHIGLLVLYLVIGGMYYALISKPVNGVILPPGGDCVSLWLVGQLVADGQIDTVYDRPAYYEYQQSVFGEAVEFRPFPYPPFFLAVLPMLGAMPYWLCCLTWFTATFGILVWGVRTWGKTGWGITLLLALAPASFATLFAGQNGYLTAGLFAGGLGLLSRRPVLAGILFGILTFKPHLGMLIPVALALRGEWKAFAAAALTTLALWGGSVLLFGWDTMLAFLEGGGSQRQVLEEWTGLLQLMIPSAFMSIRLLEGPFWLGYGISAVMALASLTAVVLVWRRCENRDLRAAVLLCAAITALPYVFNYDMGLTTVALILLYPYVTGRWQRIALALLWLTPVLVFFLNKFGLPLAPVFIAGGLYVATKTALDYSAAAGVVSSERRGD